MITKHEKGTRTADEARSLSPPTETPPSTDNDNNEVAHQEKSVASTEEDQYPHGLRLLSLVSATIVAVFLIALDQVSMAMALLHH